MNCTLRKLDVSGNCFRDEGTDYLCKAFAGNKTICDFRLDSCKIGLAGACSLARVVISCPLLQVLSIACNSLGSSGFIVLQVPPIQLLMYYLYYPTIMFKSPLVRSSKLVRRRWFDEEAPIAPYD